MCQCCIHRTKAVELLHLRSGSSLGNISSRPAKSTELVPGQPRLHREPLSWGKQANKQINKQQQSVGNIQLHFLFFAFNEIAKRFWKQRCWVRTLILCFGGWRQEDGHEPHSCILGWPDTHKVAWNLPTILLLSLLNAGTTGISPRPSFTNRLCFFKVLKNLISLLLYICRGWKHLTDTTNLLRFTFLYFTGDPQEKNVHKIIVFPHLTRDCCVFVGDRIFLEAKGVGSSLKLQLQVDVSHLTQVLGNEFGSSGKIVHTLN